MSKRFWPVALVGSFLIAALIASCSFSLSAAKIKSVHLARDKDGNSRTEVFGSNDVFYAVVDLENAPDDTEVKAVWTSVEAEGVTPNTELYETEVKAGSGKVAFSLQRDTPWEVGKYKVDIYLNDENEKSVEFEVQ
jgi:hypothetical protein